MQHRAALEANYADLAAAAAYDLDGGVRFFAGQRLDGFYVDLGSVFDLGALRPFQNLHFIPLPATPSRPPTGSTRCAPFNVHTIAVQVPIGRLTADGSVPTDQMAASAVIGVWASAHRQKGQFTNATGTTRSGPFTQVSRLGNPLVNEVVIPIGLKDQWTPPIGPTSRHRAAVERQLPRTHFPISTTPAAAST